MELSEEEKKAIEDLKNAVNEPLEAFENVVDTFKLINLDQCRIVLNLIEKQQKEIEKLKGTIYSRYYHIIKCRELEKEINKYWEDKIRELKEKVKKDKTSNPYDFVYMLDELLEE